MPAFFHEDGQALEHDFEHTADFASAHHVHVETVELLGVLGEGIGKGATALDVLRDFAQDVAQLGRFLLGDEHVEAAQQGKTGIDQGGELARHHHDLLHLHAAEVELIEALLLGAGALLVALGGFTHTRGIESQAADVVDGKGLAVGFHDAKLLLTFAVERVIEVLRHVPSPGRRCRAGARGPRSLCRYGWA
jgi:hypothetical protein